MKKEVRIKFIGFWETFKPKDSVFYKILEKFYTPVITDAPDYVICGCFEPFYNYLNEDKIRIMVCGENYIPDFNFIDYAICRYPITFLDRCFYEPGCLRPFPDCFDLQNHTIFTKKDLENKTHFCNFIASHESENCMRGDFFKALSHYKKIDSVGSYLNNSGYVVNRHDGTKREFQKKCKFTLCFESTKNEGFFTEKLTDAFLANTIPIYFGSSTVKQIFNEKRFVDVSDFSSFDDVIKRIIEIDNNDELYLSIINEPVLLERNLVDKIYNEESEFIKHIFDQNLEAARRRSKVYTPKNIENFILNLKHEKPRFRLFRKK